MPPADLKPIDVHAHPFTEETCLGHGPSYTEAHYDFFGRQPDAPHHGRQYLSIHETAETFRRANCERVVLLNMVSYHAWGRALPNDYLARYCRAYPDLFLGFGSVDPHLDARAAVRETERCKQELGLIGLKFHPAYQECFPNDRKRMYPILEACQALDLCVLIHTGTTRMTRCKIRTCQPVAIDDIATDFPTLRIIMGHMGWPWTAEALAVAWRHEHVYIDLSGWLPRYIYWTEPTVFQYLNTVLQDKFVFGSDYPAIDPNVWLDDFDALVREGFMWGGKRREIRPEVYTKFLRQNALRALKLDLPPR
ncbi:MAG: amidohydrolase family protein [Chloroflexi bacterium]|nr:amidohydrolase family protein [Chloroflexota bacterium]